MPFPDLRERTPEELACFYYYGTFNRNPNATYVPQTQGMRNARLYLQVHLAKMPEEFNLRFEGARKAESSVFGMKSSSIEDGLDNLRNFLKSLPQSPWE